MTPLVHSRHTLRTVGDLKKHLQQVPDDTPVSRTPWDTDHMKSTLWVRLSDGVPAYFCIDYETY